MTTDPLSLASAQTPPTWKQRWLRLVAGLFGFEALSGLGIWLAPFSLSTQFLVLFHTAVGLLFVLPFLLTQFPHYDPGWVRGGRLQKWLGVTGGWWQADREQASITGRGQ